MMLQTGTRVTDLIASIRSGIMTADEQPGFVLAVDDSVTAPKLLQSGSFLYVLCIFQHSVCP